jgi:phosphate transport system permease protein
VRFSLGNGASLLKIRCGQNNNFFSVLPYQVYEWVGYPKEEFKVLASAGIVLLLVLVLGLNSIAIFLRSKVIVVSRSPIIKEFT